MGITVVGADGPAVSLIQSVFHPAHTLVPVLYEDEQGTDAAHGTMGGRAQSQMHVQLALRALQGMTAQEAVSASRFIVGGLDTGDTNDHVMYEPTLEAGADPRSCESTFVSAA